MLPNQVMPARSRLPSTTPATSSPRTAGWPTLRSKVTAKLGGSQNDGQRDDDWRDGV